MKDAAQKMQKTFGQLDAEAERDEAIRYLRTQLAEVTLERNTCAAILELAPQLPPAAMAKGFADRFWMTKYREWWLRRLHGTRLVTQPEPKPDPLDELFRLSQTVERPHGTITTAGKMPKNDAVSDDAYSRPWELEV